MLQLDALRQLAGHCGVAALRGLQRAGITWSQRQYSTSASSAQTAASGDQAHERSSGEASTSSPLPPARPELVDKFLSVENLSRHERHRVERMKVTQEFQRHPHDTGSPEVVVASWTTRIRQLAEHFKSHRKQVHRIRDLEMLIHARRRMLVYMRRERFEEYAYCIQKLGLRDVYTETTSADRYPMAQPHGAPTDDRVVRRRFAFHRAYKQKKTHVWNRIKPWIKAEDPLAKVD